MNKVNEIELNIKVAKELPTGSCYLDHEVMKSDGYIGPFVKVMVDYIHEDERLSTTINVPTYDAGLL